MSGLQGTAALLALIRLRMRGRLRRLRANLKRPKTLLLALLGLGFVALIVIAQAHNDHDPARDELIASFPRVPLLSFFLTAFMVTTVIGGVRQGVMAFTPAEVHFLLPGPIGSRALILAHLINASLKVVFSALLFAALLTPGNTPWARALLGYSMIFLVLVALGLVVDLAHAKLSSAARKRRAKWIGVGLLGVAALVAALRLWLLPHDALAALAPLGWPAWPFVQLILGDDPQQIALGAALAVGALLALLSCAFGMPADVREAARGTSEVVQRKLKQMGKGQWMRDRPDAGQQRRSALRMLPTLGGAGPHLWRQLITLSRTRRGLAMLLWMTSVILGTMLFTARDTLPVEAITAMGVLMPMFMGSMFLQCDFRGDYESLAWMRSLPCSPTALAAGQLIAGTLVIFALQLVFMVWALFNVDAAARPWVAGAVPMLPALVLLQLCVENGAYLLSPHAMPGSNGQPPGAGQLLRFYGLSLVKMLTLVAALVPPGLAGALVGYWSEQPALGLIVGGAVLWLETALAVGLVGRIYLRVDPSVDLTSD
ncbi:MAG: hypothetical protein DHS20C15_05930 [Planctomycetota bacterium]|nr:MAG: hypothetical protein DHS20C15_05930 [Planctomycetota bacterium]